ncbi:MAG: nitroreductase/quinone reductase family protein [Acidimicrobiia bacterium]
MPPPWFVHTAWRVHRALYRLSGGRFLWTTSNKRGWGAMRLTAIGRKSGQERSVIVGYLEDGPNLVTIAMNGWDEGHPSWWLNLEAHPDAVVRLANGQPRRVRARLAAGEERDRLWRRWVDTHPRLDAFAAHRSTETPVVVLEPSLPKRPPRRAAGLLRGSTNPPRSAPVPRRVMWRDQQPAATSRVRSCFEILDFAHGQGQQVGGR